jgi:hypothetical protein
MGLIPEVQELILWLLFNKKIFERKQLYWKMGDLGLKDLINIIWPYKKLCEVNRRMFVKIILIFNIKVWFKNMLNIWGFSRE